MLERQLRAVQDRIEQACQRSGRKATDVELVLVTKGVEPTRVQAVYDLGHRDFGENKAQELIEKTALLPNDTKWHFIGTLQTNKARLLTSQVVLIHSVDRIELAVELNKQAEKANINHNILLQVNASGEATKHGFRPEVMESMAGQIKALSRLTVRGLMTMGPKSQDEREARATFSKTRNLRDYLKKQYPDLDWNYLSMGMSSDFEYAIEEGANLLRIGTAVFGPEK